MNKQLHDIDPEGDIIINISTLVLASPSVLETSDSRSHSSPSERISMPELDTDHQNAFVDDEQLLREAEVEPESESEPEVNDDNLQNIVGDESLLEEFVLETEPEAGIVAHELPLVETESVEVERQSATQALKHHHTHHSKDGIPLQRVSAAQIRVSSRHLILASPQARRRFQPGWEERATLSSQGILVVDEEDWDVKTFLMLMNIIHAKHRSVPKEIGLGLLARFAVLVDYYECHEAVEIYTDMWIEKLRHTVPKTYCRKLLLWICISWVFRRDKEFENATSVAVQLSKGPIKTYQLPIPERIVESIDERRQQTIGDMISALHDLLYKFRKGTDSCSNSFECDSILLGALIKGLDSCDLYSPVPTPPYSTLNVDMITKAIMSLNSPNWGSRYSSSYRSDYGRHDCKLQDKVLPLIRDSKEQKGLNLTDYVLGEIS